MPSSKARVEAIFLFTLSEIKILWIKERSEDIHQPWSEKGDSSVSCMRDTHHVSFIRCWNLMFFKNSRWCCGAFFRFSINRILNFISNSLLIINVFLVFLAGLSSFSSLIFLFGLKLRSFCCYRIIKLLFSVIEFLYILSYILVNLQTNIALGRVFFLL